MSLLHELQHRSLGEHVHRAPADEALLAVVDAEEEVGDDAEDGYEIDDECPGHRLCRLTVVEHDVDDCSYGDDSR